MSEVKVCCYSFATHLLQEYQHAVIEIFFKFKELKRAKLQKIKMSSY